MDPNDHWKMLDSCRIESENIGGTAVAFAYEALSQAVATALEDARAESYKRAVEDIRTMIGANIGPPVIAGGWALGTDDYDRLDERLTLLLTVENARLTLSRGHKP